MNEETNVYDLADLESIQLNDAFIEKNIENPADDNISRQTLQRVCDAFVKEFLFQRGDSISGLLEVQNTSAKILDETEDVLQTFIARLSSIKADIEEVRSTLASSAVELRNTRSAEKILWDTVSQFVVPPEVVQVITQSNPEQLGTQFRMCAQQLLNFLNYRRSVWMSVDFAEDEQLVRDIQLSLGESQAYAQIATVIDGLTLFACIKIKAFLSQKILLLTVNNTNFCIQQEHSLKAFSFYVHFLRSAGPLLRHIYSQNALFPYRVVRALYAEFRQEYCVIVSELYLRKMQEYVVQCNTMEFSTVTESALGAAASGFFGAVVSGGGGGNGTSLGQPSTGNALYVLPHLASIKHNSSFMSYRLGERAAIFSRIFGQPLIPTVERSNNRKHVYEETFRSMLNLLCDVVTHEYLFTFTFFSGDMSIYVEVFKPVIQFIVDYVSEVVLTQSSGVVRSILNQTPHADVNANAKNDCYGLLTLIRLCFDYRSFMHHNRKLGCLDGFFDSLLLQLWPAFKKTFEQQLVSLRCATPQAFLSSFSHLGSLKEKMSFVHPITKCFTEFSSTILSIIYGALIADKRRARTAAAAAQRSAAVGAREAAGGAERRTAANVERINTRASYGADFSNSSRSSRSSNCSEVSANDASGDTAANGRVDTRVRQSAVTAAESRGESDDSERNVMARALAIIEREKTEDAVDTSSQFTALRGNIAFMRIELLHLLEEITKEVITADGGSSAALKTDMLKLKDGFVLNNMYFMLQQPKLFPIFGEDPEGDDATLGTQESEFESLREMYEKRKTTFVNAVLQHCMPDFCNVVNDDDAFSPAEIVRCAEQFAIRWKTFLNTVREMVSSLIGDAAQDRDITAQACMQILLYNTRFHNAIARAYEQEKELLQGRSLKAILVTNQNLLQHIRTFSVVTEEEFD